MLQVIAKNAFGVLLVALGFRVKARKAQFA
jgi:hypothetical protein